MKTIYWLIFGWISPFFALITLYLKLMAKVFTLIMNMFVLVFQSIISLAGKAIIKVEQYMERRK